MVGSGKAASLTINRSLSVWRRIMSFPIMSTVHTHATGFAEREKQFGWRNRAPLGQSSCASTHSRYELRWRRELRASDVPKRRRRGGCERIYAVICHLPFFRLFDALFAKSQWHLIPPVWRWIPCRFGRFRFSTCASSMGHSGSDDSFWSKLNVTHPLRN